MIPELAELLKEVRQYTKEHTELQKAHHFLFALFDSNKIRQPGDARFLIMGINPGEQHEDFVTAPCPPVHEESFEIDFHEQYGKGRSAVKWTKTTEAFCETKQYIQSEMFFWSSKDIGMLESRFGSLTARNQPNKHLEFCNRLNRELINLTAPSAIVVPGIGCTKIMSKNFNLTFEDSIKDPESNHRLCERYSDKERTWLFTKHWSGAHGFSSDQRAIVKREIQSLNT